MRKTRPCEMPNGSYNCAEIVPPLVHETTKLPLDKKTAVTCELVLSLVTLKSPPRGVPSLAKRLANIPPDRFHAKTRFPAPSAATVPSLSLAETVCCTE